MATASQLTDRVRDLTGFDENSLKTAQGLILANAAIRRLRALVSGASERLFFDSAVVATSVGVRYVDIPAAAMTVLTVAVEADGGVRPRALDRLPWRDQYRYSSEGVAISRSFYSIMGRKIWITPTPSSISDIHIDYAPRHTDLASELTSYDMYVEGWEEWVMYDMAEKALLGRDKAAGGMRVAREDALAAILASLEIDEAAPQVMSRTYRPEEEYDGWRV